MCLLKNLGPRAFFFLFFVFVLIFLLLLQKNARALAARAIEPPSPRGPKRLEKEVKEKTAGAERPGKPRGLVLFWGPFFKKPDSRSFLCFFVLFFRVFLSSLSLFLSLSPSATRYRFLNVNGRMVVVFLCAQFGL